MKKTDIVWEPNPGAQTSFLASSAFEACYGGSAGGGKSDALMIAPLRWVAHPSFNALILRRTFAELEETLVARSQRIYKAIAPGATYNGADHVWRFPSGARIRFGYLERDPQVMQYQGAEFQYCVARGTLVRMGDGSHRPIEDVRVGDAVLTLVGPRRVTRTPPPRIKPCWRITSDNAAVIVGEDHRLLTSAGWVSPLELLSMRPRATDSTIGGSEQRCRETERPLGFQFSDQRPRLEPGRPLVPGTHRLATDAWRGDGQSVGEGSHGSHPEASQPQALSFLAVLHAPETLAVRAAGRCPCARNDASWRGGSPTLAPDSPGGCQCARGFDGEPLRVAQAVDRSSTPSPNGAAARIRRQAHEGGLARTPARSLGAKYVFPHPYTMEPQAENQGVRLSPAQMRPVGEREVFDLTVEGASHYIVMGGFVQSNCGWDELTHFTEYQYRYLLSRLRGTAGLPLRVRAGTNPGGPGHEWVQRRWGPWLGGSDWDGPRAAPGERLWYLNTEDGEKWVPRGTPEALSRVFIPARIADNPRLDPGYRGRLMALDQVTRRQLIDGDWLVRPSPGLYFRREFFKWADAAPAEAQRVRFWDLAATEDTGDNDPDWTVGVRMAAADGKTWVEDVVRLRGSPREVERSIVATAESEPHVPVRLPQDPGAGGKFQAQYLIAALHRFDARAKPETGDKITRAGPFSAQVEAGNVTLCRGRWNEDYLRELEAFPTKGIHDDQVDASSGAYAEVRNTVAISFGSAPNGPRPEGGGLREPW